MPAYMYEENITMARSANMAWLRVVAINLFILIIIFVVLELITRVTLPEYVNAYFNDTTTWGNPIYLNHIWGHRVGPDQVNAPLKRTGNENRVLFIGDSVTFGYGIDYTEIYYEVAARQLEKSGCGAVIHGAAQYNTSLEKLMNSDLRNFILDGFGANAIVYQFNVNDLDTVNLIKKSADDPLSWRERFEKFRLSYLNRSAFLKFIQSWSGRNFQRNNPSKIQESLRYSPQSDPNNYAAAWMAFENSLKGVHDTLRKRGIRFAILLVPESFQISRLEADNDLNADTSGITQWPNEKVTEIARRHQIPVLDSLPTLREYRARHPETRLYFPNDPNHPNRQGHAVLGAAVAQYLRDGLAICSPASGVPAQE
jgi:lysophospholipase L1-like esterase